MRITFQIIVAALSILGFYFILKIIASLIFKSKHIAAAVVIESKSQLSELDMLLCDASQALFAVKKRKIIVVVPICVWKSASDDEKEIASEIIEYFGASIYFVSAVDY